MEEYFSEDACDAIARDFEQGSCKPGDWCPDCQSLTRGAVTTQGAINCPCYRWEKSPKFMGIILSLYLTIMENISPILITVQIVNVDDIPPIECDQKSLRMQHPTIKAEAHCYPGTMCGDVSNATLPSIPMDGDRPSLASSTDSIKKETRSVPIKKVYRRSRWRSKSSHICRI